MSLQLVWLRNDLRLQDNPALYHASQTAEVCCVYTMTPAQWRQHNESSAKLGLWRARLIELERELAEKNIPLKLLSCDWFTAVPSALVTLAQEINAATLLFNIEYPLNEKQRDEAVAQRFKDNGIDVKTFQGDVILPPGSVTTNDHTMYKVFTPFSRKWHSQITEEHLQLWPEPAQQKSLAIDSDTIKLQWPEDVTHNYREDLWPVKTSDIRVRLHTFGTRVLLYKENRDIPSINGTSTLSPYLTMGAISARQCISSLREQDPQWQNNQWGTEIIWREFYRHLIDSFPHLSRSENFIRTANNIPWQNNEALFTAWCKGETGFPIVDAAMKQLLNTGWMHNRLRMVTAAFLTKLLFIDWRWGEAFFMQHLLDGDYASNNGGWQWAASTGADAAPYFRIFNPQRQSERFDKEGKFIKKLLPELEPLSTKTIHNPSSEDRVTYKYPQPVIDYKWARQHALDQYSSAMGKNKE